MLLLLALLTLLVLAASGVVISASVEFGDAPAMPPLIEALPKPLKSPLDVPPSSDVGVLAGVQRCSEPAASGDCCGCGVLCGALCVAAADGPAFEDADDDDVEDEAEAAASADVGDVNGDLVIAAAAEAAARPPAADVGDHWPSSCLRLADMPPRTPMPRTRFTMPRLDWDASAERTVCGDVVVDDGVGRWPGM